jgi:hypothetical protein
MPRGNQNTQGSSKIVFVKTNYSEGKFFVEVEEGTQGAVPHVITKGKREGETVYREYFNNFSGKFKGIKMELVDFGVAKEWQFMVNLDDGDEVYSYSIPCKEYNGRILALQAMKLKEDDDVSIYVFVTRPDDNGRRRTIIRFKDNETNKTVSQGFYNEETKKSSVPAPKKDEMTQEYNFSEVLSFFKEKVLPECLELTFEKKEEELEEAVTSDSSSDLPF